MPECILRIAASKQKIKAFLPRSKSIKPYSVLFKGTPVNSQSFRIARETGIKVLVSMADGDLKAQASDAVRFLRRHAADLKVLMELLGPGHMRLDFGLWDKATEERPWPTYQLPHRLITEAGRYGCEIELSFYGAAQGE